MSGPIDRHTVDQLVVAHLPAALRLARRLANNSDAAEEIVQEALCRVLSRWKSFRGEASFEANVHTCLHLARKRIAQAIGVDYAQRK